MRKLWLSALMLASQAAGAQIIRPRMNLGEPTVWVSLGIGAQGDFAVPDGTTNSTWEFGSSTPWVASIEKTIGGGGVSIGLMGTTADMGLFYRSAALGGTEADANVSQGFVTLKASGGGRDFHSLFEAGAGGTMYSNFRSRVSGVQVGPSGADTDFTFFLAYGGGYNFSPRFSVDISQRITTAMHQKDGLSAGSDTNVRMSGVEIVGRLGLGGR